MRSHPVSGNSGLPMLLGMLGEGMGAGAGLVEEEEEEEEGICAGWAAATSAAWTLGSRKQKEGGLALWMRPCSRPVLSAPRGAESACRLCRAKPVLGCSGCITLQLASGCGRNTWPWVGMLHCLDLSSILKINSLKANETLAGLHRLPDSAAVKWCSPIKTHWAHKQTFWEKISFLTSNCATELSEQCWGPPGPLCRVCWLVQGQK